MARKSKRLNEIKQIVSYEEKIEVENIDIGSLLFLKDRFKELTDERQEVKVLHLIEDIVVIVILAILSNANEWIEIEMFGKSKIKWLKTFLTLPNDTPSHDTIERVMNMIKPSELSKITIEFLINKLDSIINKKEKDIIHIDGKTMRGNGRNEGLYHEKTKSLHMVNAYSTMGCS